MKKDSIMIRTLAFFLLMATSLCGWCQEADSEAVSTKLHVDNIKADDNYIWGEGVADTDAEADQRALIDLSSRIAVSVVEKFDIDNSEVDNNGDVSTVNVTKSLMQTYTSSMLTNTKCIYLSHEPQARVFRYVHRAEVERIFNERKLRAREFVRDALECEERGRIDEALRNYYWAFCLVKSLQHPIEATLNYNGRDRLLINWIPLQMGDIFDNLHTEVSKVEGNEAELYITYKDKPLSSIEFSYWGGQGYTPPRGAKNGIATIFLPEGIDPAHLRISYEYQFKGRMRSDHELQSIMQILKPEVMPKAQQIAHCGTKKEQKEVQELFQETVAATATAAHSVRVDKPKEMTKIMERVLKAVREKQYATVEDCFTPTGYEMFNQLLNYGRATIMGDPQLSFWSMGRRTVCRSVPMNFSFKNGKRDFTENVTFTFDEEGKIESLAFALDQAACDDIFLKERPGWNDSARMVVATFLENYQTAYALKRADYLDSLFAQDALIITGCVLKKAPKTMENTRYLDNQYVKLTKQSKEDYMERLRKCMKSNEYINIHFSSTDVRKAQAKYGEAYGILLKQHYYSSNYADTGYLFLAVDMKDVEKPVILVRTWQPKRDYSINAHMADDSPYKGLICGANFQ